MPTIPVPCSIKKQVLPTDSPSAQPSANGGKLAVFSIFALALAMASFAWWWNYNRGRRTMEFYGAPAATLIRTAPLVALRIGEREVDISQAPGLLNARTSLLSDASYRWNQTTALTTDPDASVRFTRGNDVVTVAFTFETQSVQPSSTGKTATLIPKTAEGWRSFLTRSSKPTGLLPKTPAGH